MDLPDFLLRKRTDSLKTYMTNNIKNQDYFEIQWFHEATVLGETNIARKTDYEGLDIKVQL